MTAAPFDVKKMCCRGAKLPLLMWKQSLWNFTSASSVFRFVLPASLFQPSPTGGEPARSLRRARFPSWSSARPDLEGSRALSHGFSPDGSRTSMIGVDPLSN